jgi:hypothetical protein
MPRDDKPQKGNRGRSEEAQDPNRPTFVDPVTGETEKEGLGPREGKVKETETETTETTTEVEPEQPEG